LGEGRAARFSFAPGQLELLEQAKSKAKESRLWNFFLPNADTGEGLSNLDYAYIAAELGKEPLASETLNCSAPDTDNMEVLERVGTSAQKERWLKPLLEGEIRSCYAMTEPNVASSDAKNIQTRAELSGSEWIINGEKYYISGAGDPRCKIMICMVKTSPNAEGAFQQSQILLPMDTPGVEVLGPMCVFGDDAAPRGHMHVRLENVRVPESNILLGEGRGFEISQIRSGRIEFGSAWSRRWCRKRYVRLLIRPSRFTAQRASPNGRRWRSFTPMSDTLGLLMARTKCITWWLVELSWRGAENAVAGYRPRVGGDSDRSETRRSI
jgi:acyl-CoA dehydrogenase